MDALSYLIQILIVYAIIAVETMPDTRGLPRSDELPGYKRDSYDAGLDWVASKINGLYERAFPQ